MLSFLRTVFWQRLLPLVQVCVWTQPAARAVHEVATKSIPQDTIQEGMRCPRGNVQMIALCPARGGGLTPLDGSTGVK